MTLNLAILASGSGTNALNLLSVARNLDGIKIVLLIVDQSKSPLLNIAKERYPELPVMLIEEPSVEFIQDSKGRKLHHEKAILKELQQHHVDWIFLAGYMRLLGETLLGAFTANGQSKIVNIHPSLLPAYPGLHAYERAFQANDVKAGVTIHLVDEGVDTGSILAQESFERKPSDTLKDFVERGKTLEWNLYAQILKELSKARVLNPMNARKA